MGMKVNTWFDIMLFRLRQAVLMWLHTVFKKPLAIAVVYFGLVLRKLGKRSIGLKFILKGRRVDDVARANSVIRNIVHQEGGSKAEFEAILGDRLEHSIEYFQSRILILKLPRLLNGKMIEKGAIIIKFSETFAPVYACLNVQLVSKYFRIILEPSSVGYSLADILVWTTLGSEKVIVLSPYQNDFELLSIINANLVPVILGPADWANTSIFYNIPDTGKVYDAIYVANFNPIKRVERYIHAIVRICRKHPNYKAALVCAGHGAAKKEILAILEQAKKYASIDVFSDLSQAGINELFNKSKVNILVSLREGSNKGLAEGLFSGVPALLIKENVGGNHAHINKHTGRVVPDSNFDEVLLWFADHYAQFSPHKWAISHITPAASTSSLSNTLKEIEISEGRPWTKELFVKVNSPELAYLDSDHSWLLSKRAEFLTSFSRSSNEKDIMVFLERLQNTVAD